MSKIETIWREIEHTRLKANFYGHDFPMNPASSPDRIEQYLSKTTGFYIPQQLRESLMIFDGMDRNRGVWRIGFIPLSVDDIVETWLNDRQREQEAIDEGDDVIKRSHHIPIMYDPTLHHEIYMDARDGSVLNYNVDGGWFEGYSFVDYHSWLIAVRDFRPIDGYMEWPTLRENGG